MMINKSASVNEVRLAIAFASFMTKPEQQLQAIAQTQSFIPVNRHVMIGNDLLPLGAVLVQQAQTAIAIPLDHLAQLRPLLHQGEAIYQQAIAGTLSSKQAAKELQELAVSPQKRERE
jgi:ABC-type glycerol-3-phosphate transport system substrate-binding protein